MNSLTLAHGLECLSFSSSSEYTLSLLHHKLIGSLSTAECLCQRHYPIGKLHQCHSGCPPGDPHQPITALGLLAQAHSALIGAPYWGSRCVSLEQQLKHTSLYKRLIDAKDYLCVAAAQRSWTVHRWSARCCPSCWRAAQRVWRRSAALHWRGSWALLNRMLSWLSSTSASSQAATTSSPITLTPTGGTSDDHMT